MHVGFFCIAAYMIYSALTIAGDTIGDYVVRVMLFGMGAFMMVVVILSIYIFFKRPVSSEPGPQRLIDQRYTGPQTEYCRCVTPTWLIRTNAPNAGSRRNGYEH